MLSSKSSFDNLLFISLKYFSSPGCIICGLGHVCGYDCWKGVVHRCWFMAGVECGAPGGFGGLRWKGGGVLYKTWFEEAIISVELYILGAKFIVDIVGVSGMFDMLSSVLTPLCLRLRFPINS